MDRDQHVCELCGRELATGYGAGVCPMCKQEFASLKEQAAQRFAAPAEPPIPKSEGSSADSSASAPAPSEEKAGREPANASAKVVAQLEPALQHAIPRKAPPVTNKPPLPRSRDATFVICGALVLFGVFVVILTIADFRTESYGQYLQPAAEQRDATRSTLTKSATALWQEYHDNEIAADAKWLNKQISLEGKVDSVKSELAPGGYLRAYIMLDGNGIFRGVQCSFDEWDENAFAKLKVGQKIYIRGRVLGKIDSGAVLLAYCSL